MPVVRLRGPLKRLAGDCSEHVLDGRVGRGAAGRARARASGGQGLDPRRARGAAARTSTCSSTASAAGRTRRSTPRTGSTSFPRSREACGSDDRAARRDEEGPVRARGRAGRAVRGDRARVRRRAGRVRAARPALRPRARVRDLAVLRAEDLVRRRPRGRVGAGGGRRAARARRRGARADLGDRAGRGRGHALRRRRPGRAVREPRRRRDLRASTAGSGSIRAGDSWQPGAGGLCLHSIATWPGEPRPARGRHLRRRRVADRRRRRDLAARQRGPRRALPARRRRPRTRSRCACTACSGPPSGPSGCSCSSTAASTAPTTRARRWTDIAAGPAVGLRLPARDRSRPTPTART